MCTSINCGIRMPDKFYHTGKLSILLDYSRLKFKVHFKSTEVTVGADFAYSQLIDQNRETAC